ncbi:MAG: hypothetical protein V1899_08945 [Planctomycetota bacterium]
MAMDNLNPISPDSSSKLEVHSPVVDDELLLHRYLDGRLGEKEQTFVNNWLNSSAAARRTLAALREEDQLLREALESRIEPSKRFSDKALATLHNEERVRLHVVRGRRLRRQVLAVMSVAAAIILCLYLVKPREPVGLAVSGTGATVQTPVGEVHAFSKNSPLYEGDLLITTQSQFVRLRLSNGAILDVDEQSRISPEKGLIPTLRMDTGRVGINAANSKQDVLIHLPQGMVRVLAGALVDLWLPQPSGALSPELFDAQKARTMQTTRTNTSSTPATMELSAVAQASLPAVAQASLPAVAQASSPAVITVIKGMAFVATEKYPEGFSVADGVRSVFTPQSRIVRPINLAGSRVLELRSDASWHALDNLNPANRILLGLLDAPDFMDLGWRLGLTRKGPAIEQALKALQEGMLTGDVHQRTQKLATGQVALRAAYETLHQEDEVRRIGRMLEGLAHIERGLALASASALTGANSAHVAFSAASVAFDEAQQPLTASVRSPLEKVKLIWPGMLKNDNYTRTLAELSPLAQSELLAAFYHSVAAYWLARTATETAPDTEKAMAAAVEFTALSNDLGCSVEALAAQLGESFAWRLAGKPEKAIAALQHLLATSLAGSTPASRHCAEGIRQAALFALVKLYISTGNLRKAEDVGDDFWLLYPLEMTSPIAREIQRALEGDRLITAEQALRQKNYQVAVELFDELLIQSPRNELKIEMRLNLIRALIELKNGVRVRSELEKLATTLPAERRAEFDRLAKEVKALPSNIAPSR